MKVFKKIINILIDVLIVCVLLISVLVVALALSSKANAVPSIFGYTFQTISSDSMKDEFKAGDLVLGKLSQSDDEYEVGDVVTYLGYLQGYEDMGEQLICHRIIEKNVNADGIAFYQTQGDNREISQVPDQDSVEDGITSASIVSYYQKGENKCAVIPNVGKVLSFLRTQLGFFLCILLPMIIFFLYQLIRFILNYASYTQEKKALAADAGGELSEEQKRQAVEEYLAKQHEEEIKKKAVEEYLEQQKKNETATKQ